MVRWSASLFSPSSSSPLGGVISRQWRHSVPSFPLPVSAPTTSVMQWGMLAIIVFVVLVVPVCVLLLPLSIPFSFPAIVASGTGTLQVIRGQLPRRWLSCTWAAAPVASRGARP